MGVNERFDFSDDFKCPGYSRATAHAAAAGMPRQQLNTLGKALVTICRHNGARPIRLNDGCGLGCDSGAWFLLEDIARLNKRHFGNYDWMLNKSLEAAIMEIVQVVMDDTRFGKGRFQIGVEVYQEGGGFSGNELTLPTTAISWPGRLGQWQCCHGPDDWHCATRYG